MMKKHFAFILLVILTISSPEASAQNNVYIQVQSLLESSKPEAAMQVLDSLEKTGNHASENVYQYYKAKTELSLQHHEASLHICKNLMSRLTKKDTLLHKIYFISSLACDQLGNRDETISYLHKAIRLKPDEISYYINSSFYHGERGDYKTCLSHLDKAIKLEPKNVYVLNNLSYYSSMNHEYSKAMDYANQGLKLTTSNDPQLAKDSNVTAFLLNNRGFAQMGMRNFEAAMRDIDDALILNPENAFAYYNKALLYILLEEENEPICENLQMAVLYGYIYTLEEMTATYCK